MQILKCFSFELKFNDHKREVFFYHRIICSEKQYTSMVFYPKAHSIHSTFFFYPIRISDEYLSTPLKRLLLVIFSIECR